MMQNYEQLYNQAIQEILVLREYIERVEAECEYYKSSSQFAGVPDTPPPTELQESVCTLNT